MVWRGVGRGPESGQTPAKAGYSIRPWISPFGPAYGGSEIVPAISVASDGADATDGLAARRSEDEFPRINAYEGSQGRSRFAQRRVDGR